MSFFVVVLFFDLFFFVKVGLGLLFCLVEDKSYSMRTLNNLSLIGFWRG